MEYSMQSTSLDLRFRLGGIPVRVEPWFWLTGLVLGGSLTGARLPLWLLVMFVSILVHELGHALAARAFGARAHIRLYAFGGLTYPDRRLPRWRNVAMTLAGPFAGFARAALTFGLIPFLPADLPMLHWVAQQSLAINIGWGVMNLLPVPPLDGGHVALGVLGPRRVHIGHGLGIATAVLVALAALRFNQVYLALRFGFLAFQNVQTLRALRG